MRVGAANAHRNKARPRGGREFPQSWLKFDGFRAYLNWQPGRWLAICDEGVALRLNDVLPLSTGS